MWAVILGASVVSAILGRLGGAAGFNKLYRRIGCMLVSGVCMVLYFKAPWYIHLLSAGLLYAALTTYGDEIFGYDNHWFHGFIIALAYLPFASVSGLWVGFILRVVILTVLVGFWSAWIKHHVVEELGRYFFLPLTLPLLFFLQ